MWPISDFQYGFRSSGSTTDLLAFVSDRIARAFNRSGATRAVALDISKAFDRIWHADILHKPKSYGISGQILTLFFLFSVIDGFEWFWMGRLRKNIQLALWTVAGSGLLISVLEKLSYFLLTSLITLAPLM